MARGKYKKGAGSVSLLMAILGDKRVGEAFFFTGASRRGNQSVALLQLHVEFNGLV